MANVLTDSDYEIFSAKQMTVDQQHAINYTNVNGIDTCNTNVTDQLEEQ